MRTIDADALKKEWSMANKCEECPQDARKCQYEQNFTRMDICEMLDEAPTVSGWISVKDRLPEVGQKVLTYSKYGHVSDRTLERHGGQNGYDVLLFSPDGMKPGTDITHWMPLPEPPKGV